MTSRFKIGDRGYVKFYTHQWGHSRWLEFEVVGVRVDTEIWVHGRVVNMQGALADFELPETEVNGPVVQ